MDPATTSMDENGALRAEVDRLKSDLQRLRADFSTLGGDAMHAAKAGADQARHRIADAARAAKEKGRQSMEAIEHQVGEHPFISIGTAFAVGLVLGMSLGRKD